jgi:hypothetical protein
LPILDLVIARRDWPTSSIPLCTLVTSHSWPKGKENAMKAFQFEIKKGNIEQSNAV